MKIYIMQYRIKHLACSSLCWEASHPRSWSVIRPTCLPQVWEAPQSAKFVNECRMMCLLTNKVFQSLRKYCASKWNICDSSTHSTNRLLLSASYSSQYDVSWLLDPILHRACFIYQRVSPLRLSFGITSPPPRVRWGFLLHIPYEYPSPPYQ